MLFYYHFFPRTLTDSCGCGSLPKAFSYNIKPSENVSLIWETSESFWPEISHWWRVWLKELTPVTETSPLHNTHPWSVSHYRLAGSRTWWHSSASHYSVVRIPAEARDFVSSNAPETGCGAQPTSYLTGNGDFFPEAKAAEMWGLQLHLAPKNEWSPPSMSSRFDRDFTFFFFSDSLPSCLCNAKLRDHV